MKYPCSILIFAAAATTTHAGLDSIEVIFAITGDLGYGDTTMSAQFDAISYEDGDAIFLEFESPAGDFDSTSPFNLGYEDLSVTLEDKFIDGTFTLLATDGSTSEMKSLEFTGLGTAWDGTSASGTGLATTDTIGFAPETHDITWSITVVPAPATLGVLGLAALGRRRRRD